MSIKKTFIFLFIGLFFVVISFSFVEGNGNSSTTDTHVGQVEITLNGKQKRICDPSFKLENGEYQCCGIKLLTPIPFIGKCIYMLSQEEIKALGEKANINPKVFTISEYTAFPRLMLGLTKILVTVILLGSFIAIIVAGVMMAASGTKEEGYNKGKAIIGGVIAGLALLGASGVILRLINPNFFG